MTKLLLLDFESVDFGIQKGLGPGWVFKANGLDTVRFEIAGWSTSILDIDTMMFSGPQYFAYSWNLMDNFDREILRTQLSNSINNLDGIIAHDIRYELGCLEVLGIKVTEDKQIYDTKIIAQLVNNEVEHIAGRSAFSLENLSEVYLPKEQRKAIDILVDAAIGNKLVDEPKRKGYNVERFRALVQKWCYENMDKLPVEAVAEYCNQDLVATANLFKLFIKKEAINE